MPSARNRAGGQKSRSAEPRIFCQKCSSFRAANILRRLTVNRCAASDYRYRHAVDVVSLASKAICANFHPLRFCSTRIQSAALLQRPASACCTSAAPEANPLRSRSIPSPTSRPVSRAPLCFSRLGNFSRKRGLAGYFKQAPETFLTRGRVQGTPCARSRTDSRALRRRRCLTQPGRFISARFPDDLHAVPLPSCDRDATCTSSGDSSCRQTAPSRRGTA